MQVPVRPTFFGIDFAYCRTVAMIASASIINPKDNTPEESHWAQMAKKKYSTNMVQKGNEYHSCKFQTPHSTSLMIITCRLSADVFQLKDTVNCLSNMFVVQQKKPNPKSDFRNILHTEILKYEDVFKDQDLQRWQGYINKCNSKNKFAADSDRAYYLCHIPHDKQKGEC